jgi:hypothetical protein
MKYKFIPSKEIIYQFISNLILLILTLFIGNYYISYKLQKIEGVVIEQKKQIENKIEFVKNFTKLGQSRIYQAENYIENKKNSETEEVLIRSWENYMDAVKLWNEENLRNPIFIKLYFGLEMQKEYYNDLLPEFISLHKSLLELRTGKKIDNIDDILEGSKHKLFVFSEKMIFE